MTQRTSLGRLKKIPYKEVLSIAHEPDGITILGENDTIEHTSSHADGEYFASVVSKRSGKRVD